MDIRSVRIPSIAQEFFQRAGIANVGSGAQFVEDAQRRCPRLLDGGTNGLLGGLCRATSFGDGMNALNLRASLTQQTEHVWLSGDNIYIISIYAGGTKSRCRQTESRCILLSTILLLGGYVTSTITEVVACAVLRLRAILSEGVST